MHDSEICGSNEREDKRPGVSEQWTLLLHTLPRSMYRRPSRTYRTRGGSARTKPPLHKGECARDSNLVRPSGKCYKATLTGGIEGWNAACVDRRRDGVCNGDDVACTRVRGKNTAARRVRGNSTYRAYLPCTAFHLDAPWSPAPQYVVVYAGLDVMP